MAKLRKKGLYSVPDVLIYWRDYAANRGTLPRKASGLPDSGGGVLSWHSSAKCIAELQPGDRMWMVTSGKGLREEAEQAAFLVGVWAVREVIDALHRCCAFCDKGDTGGLSEYLARSGHGSNEKLWTVAQAISEVLPDGDKEKQLLQGLLNQRDKIDEAMAEERLF